MVQSQSNANGSKSVNDSQHHSVIGESNPLRLCYVDDSRTSAYVVKRLLRPYGYVVDHYNSAEPALIALVQDKYDLLLTDLKVSAKGMDGDDLVRALRNSGHEKISSMPVIVITGSTDQSVLSDVYEAGANQVMNKPVSGDELDEQIRKLVLSAKNTDVETKSTISTHAKIDSNKVTGPVETIVLQQDVPGDLSESLHGGTVVPFGTDSIQSRQSNNEINDNIPILKAVDPEYNEDHSEQNLIQGLDSENSFTGKDKAEANIVNNFDGEVATKPKQNNSITTNSVPERTNRRVIKPDYPAPTESANRPQPQPAVDVRPATRVNPTVGLRKPNEGKIAQNTSGSIKINANSASITQSPAQNANKRLLKKGNIRKQSTVKVSDSNRQTELPQQQNSQKDAAAAAVLLAKKKKAELARKAILAQQAKKAKQAKIAAALAAKESLALEPIENNQGQVFKSNAAMTGSAASSDAQIQQEAFKPTSAETTSAPLPEDQLRATPPQSNFDPNANILQEMEKYPLVEADLDSGYTPSRLASALGSIFELYGMKRILMSFLMLLAAYFGYQTYQDYFHDGTPVEVTSVEQGEIFQSITYPGKVVSKLRVNMTPSIAGRLTNVYIEEGDTVKSGDLLARLDDREAKSFLTRVKATLNSAKEDVVLAERALKRLKQAFTKGAVAKQLVEDAEVELRSAKARESIAKEEVRSAKLSLENPKIVAPFAGTITARYVEVGQWVVPSETLFTLIDEKQREIEVHVDAADSGGIAVGQTVGLSSDAFPGLEWSESVTRLAAATNNIGNANTVSVFISLGNNAPSLRFGQQVDADIRTAWNPNAIKIPYAAIINRKGASWVATIEDGMVNLVEVVTGIEDFSHVEILQGVNVGQSVILINGKDFEQGDKVSLASGNSSF